MAVRSDGGETLTDADSELAHVTSNYLMVTNVPLFRNQDGEICAGQLWFKDLAEHLSYLDRFTIACPIISGMPTEIAVFLHSDPRFSRVQVVELPAVSSTTGSIFALPRTVWRLTSQVRKAEIVHSVVAGWPIPYGWIVTPLARIFRKKLVIIVESAPWRLKSGLPQKLKSRLAATVYERLARWCLGRTDLPIFTQDEYRRSLLTREPERGHVIHASWIDAEVVVTNIRAEALWLKKTQLGSNRLSIIFVGRLEQQKGLAVLLNAMSAVARQNLSVTLDILGAGELASNCEEMSRKLQGSTRVNLLGTVAYGAPLFELLQGYHAVILPSISDEQPRIVYDAYSQGVPVLASSTAGLRDCVRDGVTGWLVEPNDVEALERAIERAAKNVPELRRMGMEALGVARSMTHQRMHSERQRLLLRLVEPSAA